MAVSCWVNFFLNQNLTIDKEGFLFFWQKNYVQNVQRPAYSDSYSTVGTEGFIQKRRKRSSLLFMWQN